MLFTALRGMQTRSSDENYSVCPYVCPSVRLSVKRMNSDKTEEKSIQSFMPYERTFSPFFLRRMNGCWGQPLLPESLGQPVPVGAKSPNLN